jgi:hypothetical protein
LQEYILKTCGIIPSKFKLMDEAHAQFDNSKK